MFVTFEGGEGAGKSTQVARLAARLTNAGHTVVRTREPGGSPRAEALRSVLLRGDVRPFGPLAETLVFAAARADHVERTIRSALADGAIVLCDRFIDSTRVYQGEVAGVPARVLDALERITVGATRPDLTVVLDLPASEGLARAGARRGAGETADRFEAEGLHVHETVRRAFLTIAAAEPRRCAVVDARGSPDTIEAAIWEIAQGLLSSQDWRIGRAA